MSDMLLGLLGLAVAFGSAKGKVDSQKLKSGAVLGRGGFIPLQTGLIGTGYPATNYGEAHEATNGLTSYFRYERAGSVPEHNGKRAAHGEGELFAAPGDATIWVYDKEQKDEAYLHLSNYERPNQLLVKGFEVHDYGAAVAGVADLITLEGYFPGRDSFGSLAFEKHRRNSVPSAARGRIWAFDANEWASNLYSSSPYPRFGALLNLVQGMSPGRGYRYAMGVGTAGHGGLMGIERAVIKKITLWNSVFKRGLFEALKMLGAIFGGFAVAGPAGACIGLASYGVATVKTAIKNPERWENISNEELLALAQETASKIPVGQVTDAVSAVWSEIESYTTQFNTIVQRAQDVVAKFDNPYMKLSISTGVDWDLNIQKVKNEMADHKVPYRIEKVVMYS